MLLPLHLPRRHRRPLLFPPGLLALAWLLWLGCVALPQMRGMERPLQSVLQITAVPLHANEGWPLEPPVYSSEQQLDTFRNWQTVAFTGNIFNDYFSFSQAKKVAEFVKTDSTFRAGMQINFSDQASMQASFMLLICSTGKTLRDGGWTFNITQQHYTPLSKGLHQPYQYSSAAILITTQQYKSLIARIR